MVCTLSLDDVRYPDFILSNWLEDNLNPTRDWTLGSTSSEEPEEEEENPEFFGLYSLQNLMVKLNLSILINYKGIPLIQKINQGCILHL